MATEALRIGKGRFIDLLGALIPQAGNLGNLGDYFALGGEVFTILRSWSDIEESIDTKVGLQARLRLVVKLGKLYSARTPNVDDDQLVALLESGVENESVVEFIASLLARFKAQAGDNTKPTVKAFQQFLATDNVQKSLEELAVEQQIDLATIMEIIQLVMKLIAMFKPAAVPTTPAGSTVLNF
jgi:hypothetical protein